MVELKLTRGGRSAGAVLVGPDGVTARGGSASLEGIVSRMNNGLRVRVGMSDEERAVDGWETISANESSVAEIEAILWRLGYQVKAAA